MHDLVKKTSLYSDYIWSPNNKNKRVMEWKSTHKLTFTYLKSFYEYFNQQVTFLKQ